jgi:hypothetical protein
MPANATGLNTSASAETQRTDAPTPNDIAVLAYALWVERGCPDGSPDEDWLRAEQAVRELHHQR